MDSAEVTEFWSAWYAAFGTWDSTINFWLTATFAVVVAAHTLRESMTKRLARLLAWLYGAFCLYTLLRGGSLYIEGVSLSSQMMANGIRFTLLGSILNLLSNITILAIFCFGSIATIRFILTSSGPEDETK